MEKQDEFSNMFPLIPMANIDDLARKIAVAWGDEYFPGIALQEKHKLASDIMNYHIIKSKQENDTIKDMATKGVHKDNEQHSGLE